MKMRMQSKSLGLHKVSGSILNGSVASALLAATLIFQVGGYMIIEGMGFVNAAYMVIITFSTVGYGEIVELSSAGRVFTMICIVLNVAVFTYVVAVFSYFIIQGRLFKKLHGMHIDNKIKNLENHVIICGYGRYGIEVTEQLMSHGIPFVVVEKSEEIIRTIQESPLDIPYVEGNATNDEVLKDAGIDRAKSLISTLPEDSENLFVVLSAKQLNSDLNIISRAHDKATEGKLKFAGASHVILPDQIGGFYMATLISKPETIEFFSFLTQEFESDVGFAEIHESNLPSKCMGMSISELNIRKATGANIIGYKTENGKYIINPEPDTCMTKNSSFIIIGDKSQLDRLKIHLNGFKD